MIVDLAVEDSDRIAVFASQWLIAAPQVDDLEANRAKRHIFRLVDPLLIGSAMVDRGDDPANNSSVYSPMPMCESRNAAQTSFSPFTGDLYCIAHFGANLLIGRNFLSATGLTPEFFRIQTLSLEPG